MSLERMNLDIWVPDSRFSVFPSIISVTIVDRLTCDGERQWRCMIDLNWGWPQEGRKEK